jgi:peptidylprolyl isomerase
MTAGGDGDTLIIELSTGGTLKIATFPDKAPNHVARIKELANSGFYDGVVFHRVIEGFMAQTGDPDGTGSGGSGQNINAEFNDVAHVRGVLSMARAQDPNSADSQFFIMLADAPHLDGQYTAWGRVIEGIEFVDAIPKGPSKNNGVVPEEERAAIVTMRVGNDD